MNLIKWFFPQILMRTTSRFNKDIRIVELFGRRSLRVNGLTQSGSIVEDIYKSILPLKISNFQFPISNVLILGFGAGSFAKIINKKFPRAKITGIEIDPVIIELAKKYFELDKIKNLKIIIGDAKEFDNNQKYDLIFVDLYRGEKIADFVDSEKFLKSLAAICTGTVVFNRLNFSRHKSENYDFLNKLNLLFSGIRTKKSYSNLIVYCSK